MRWPRKLKFRRICFEQAKAQRLIMVEAAAEQDDELIAKYLDGVELTEAR